MRERDGEECRVESRRVSRRQQHADDTCDDVRATHLEFEPMSMCDIKMSAVKHRENVTCEGVLFTHPVGCSRLLSAVNDLTTTKFQKKSCQVSL